jgi:hypothetical protein
MSGLTAERAAAIRAATIRAARDRRIRETPCEDRARLAGRYRGPHRDFTLEWVEDECGYRMHVEQQGSWRWEDPTVLSAAHIRARLTSGEWKMLRVGPLQTAVERTEGEADDTSHQRGHVTGEPRRAQIPDQRTRARFACQEKST